MTTPIELGQESVKLPPIERAKIVDLVMRDFIQPDLDIDKKWAKRVSNRWNAYKRGEVNPIPYDEVMSRYKKS